MQDDPSAPGRRSALVTLPGLPAIYRRHAKGHAREDGDGCEDVISDRGPGGRREKNTFRPERLAERAARPAVHVARLERQRRGDEA
jgi:hypothetical protein